MSAVLPLSMAEDFLARSCAADIRDAFADYNRRFAEITRRAKGRFEQRDWLAAHQDVVERIELYDQCAARTQAALEDKLGARLSDKRLWSAIKLHYQESIADLLDQELNKTFYNTVTRRFFKTRGVDPNIEFVAFDIEPTDRITHPVERYSYAVTEDLARVFQRVLADFAFACPYAHPSTCADRLAEATRQRFAHWGDPPIHSLELLTTVFYRERRAYLIGRVFGEERFSPFVIALVNDAQGIRADALLSTPRDLAQLFSFTRSYFLADFDTVGDAVVFLRVLLPRKPIDEIYTTLGRAKQGKTERYRHFYRHFERSEERFELAAGERGMVMAVFTLPSYALVFKIIRDRFAAPKDMTREEVSAKYRLVFRQDRVGRLIEAQEFQHLRFPKHRFTPAVLEDLLGTCAGSVLEDGDDLVLKHVYTERRLRPLNLYLREAEPEAARAALLDYGQAIKDLAMSNIFPGDLLLKNFGVSRYGRVIFYDYDELCLVSECRFRQLPEPGDEDDTRGNDWYYVDPRDVFPEQFIDFLGLDANQRALLLRAHAEIFDPRWWTQLQQRIARGEFADLPPYGAQHRLTGIVSRHEFDGHWRRSELEEPGR